MSQMQSVAGSRPRAQSDAGEAGAIPIVTLGLSLSLFFVISYVICIAGYLWLPGLPVQHARAVDLFAGVRTAELAELLPGNGGKLHLGLVHHAGLRAAVQLFPPARGALSKGAAQ